MELLRTGGQSLRPGEIRRGQAGGSNASSQAVPFGYDPVGNVTTSGHFSDTSMSTSVFTTTNTYDHIERLSAVTNNSSSVSLTQSYGYNADGWLTSESNSTDGSRTYVYDDDGRETAVNKGSGSSFVNEAYTYDLAGNRLSATSGTTHVASIGVGLNKLMFTRSALLFVVFSVSLLSSSGCSCNHDITRSDCFANLVGRFYKTRTDLFLLHGYNQGGSDLLAPMGYGRTPTSAAAFDQMTAGQRIRHAPQGYSIDYVIPMGTHLRFDRVLVKGCESGSPIPFATLVDGKCATRKFDVEPLLNDTRGRDRFIFEPNDVYLLQE
jgi:YD repeat-containing protein